MPTARESRMLAASPDRVWDVVGDPHHLPRWWPRVTRVEDVREDAFTEVLAGAKGKMLRADFRLVECQPRRRAVWAQEIDGTPFARVLRSAETRIELVPLDGRAVEVVVELRQTLRGLLARLGSPMVRRAAASTIREALDGLEQAVVG